MPGSPSSTPPTCTATAAASRSSAGSCARPRLPSSRSPPRWAAAPTQEPGELHARQLPRLDRPLPPQPRRRHPRPGPAALPAAPRSTPPTRSRRARRAGRGGRRSPATASASRPATRRSPPSRGRASASVQIILNAFRLKPLDEVLPAAREAGVGIIARVPLASGLLSRQVHARHDVRRRRPPHLQPRRRVRSTWARPSPASTTRRACEAAREFSALVEKTMPGTAPAAAALAWIAAQPGVSTVIPGARSRAQAEANASAGSLDVPPELDEGVRDIYDEYFRASVHPRW